MIFCCVNDRLRGGARLAGGAGAPSSPGRRGVAKPRPSPPHGPESPAGESRACSRRFAIEQARLLRCRSAPRTGSYEGTGECGPDPPAVRNSPHQIRKHEPGQTSKDVPVGQRPDRDALGHPWTGPQHPIILGTWVRVPPALLGGMGMRAAPGRGWDLVIAGAPWHSLVGRKMDSSGTLCDVPRAGRLAMVPIVGLRVKKVAAADLARPAQGRAADASLRPYRLGSARTSDSSGTGDGWGRRSSASFDRPAAPRGGSVGGGRGPMDRSLGAAKQRCRPGRRRTR